MASQRIFCKAQVEWPTVAVAVFVYTAFGLLTWFYHVLPWWLLLPAGGFVVALHGSLQHEVVHGHPTRWPALNEALVYPSLWLWLAFRRYRATHLTHHATAALTDPVDDPESNYLDAARWNALSPLRRTVLCINNTLSGRLIIGPAIALARAVSVEGRVIARGNRADLVAWAHHGAGAALVIAWVSGACAIPLGEYVLLFACPGLALTLLRSFAEHQAHPIPGARTVIIEADPITAFMFLNNNLHAVHHREPGLAWYRLARRWRETREQTLIENEGYYFSGYGALAAACLLRAKEPVRHPG